MTFNSMWDVIPHTGERVLQHKVTLRTIQFTDDLHAPNEEYDRLGLADLFCEEDLKELRNVYTQYELASGGA